MQVQQKKYAAFISYRHMMPDMAIAKKVAQMLERNRVRPDRKSPRNIRPVFLDTNELPLLESLDDGIVQALENSECLIVICSPNLPLSKYCMREITYFKELHGGSTARIFTLLVAGTPEESFPDVLRYSTRVIQDENGIERTETVEIEPLFADVRADTLRQSMRKLRKTEYLRLTAAYYGCSYDALYQRRKRRLWRIGLSAGACATAVALGFGMYVHTRNVQYNAAKAATFASYARAETEKGNELLAIALCKESWPEAQAINSQQYMAALRSAVVQLDYKWRALPVGPVMQTAYLDSSNTHLIISWDENIAIVDSDYIYQFNDAKTGMLLQQQPQDVVQLNHRDPRYYITIGAKTDEKGVIWDTMAFWSLEDHHLVNTIYLRPSETEFPNYRVDSYIDCPGLLSVSDDGEVVIWLDEQGNQLTEAQVSAKIIGSAIGNAQIEETAEPPFYYTIGNVRRPASVKNQAGETVLELEARQHITAFSHDYSHFAYVHEGMLKVYETSGWTMLSEVPIIPGSITTLSLLQNSSYVLMTYRGEDAWWYIDVMDWRTGQPLASLGGYAFISGKEPFFYSTDQGSLTRYHYNDMDLSKASEVVDQDGTLCLLAREQQIVLQDADTGRVLLEADTRLKWSSALWLADLAQASDDFSRILVSQPDGLHCYDRAGQQVWQTDATEMFALSMDGKTATWLDANGQVQVASAEDGSILYAVELQQMLPGDQVIFLAVSDAGVYISAFDKDYRAHAVWVPAYAAQGIALENYQRGTLYPNGLLFLERSAYVKDFAVWDVERGEYVYQPASNTGAWCYSPESGYLVRRVETSDNHGTLELEVLRFARGSYETEMSLSLPATKVTDLRLDSTGKVLSVTAGDRTVIHDLPARRIILETTGCPLYYENGRFWSIRNWGEDVYCIPMLEGNALYAYAMQLITGPSGMRELTTDERSRYPFEQ